jgi:hypothetical protein
MQRNQRYYLLFIFAIFLCYQTSSLLAQTGQSNVPAPGGINRPADPTAQFTPEQHERFNSALQLFRGERYTEAYGIFKPLFTQLSPGTPGQILVAKLTAESAINTGDRDFALETLKPIEAADANDWQAAGLLARVYAESGQKQQRDAEIVHLIDLHKRAVTPQIAQLQQILLERISTANGSLRIWYSLEPWGPYKTQTFCRVYDQTGQQVFRISLESGDFDQPLFAKQHPELAAQGMRLFTLDGYGQPQKQPNGNSTFTHMTFGFFNGQPSYDSIREKMVQIAEGKTGPMSKTERTTP